LLDSFNLGPRKSSRCEAILTASVPVDLTSGEARATLHLQLWTDMRVIEIETFGYGGLAHYAHNLCAALAERGHEITLITTDPYELEGQTSALESVRLVKAIHRRAPASGHGRFAASRFLRKVDAVRDAFSVARLCQSLPADVIHLHCTNPIALLYLQLLRRLQPRLVYTAHVVTPHEPMRVQRQVYGRINRLSDLVIAHSRTDRDRLVAEWAVDPGSVTVIPHGEYGFFERAVELPGREESRRQLGIASNERAALFFGYIREYKGLDLLLDAWPSVLALEPNARLLIVGDPVQLPAARRQELAERARALGAICRFEYVPFDEVGRYLVAADVLTIPYRRISQSGIVFLGLGMSLPIVASRLGPFAETLRHEESALLVEPGSVEELAAAVARLLGDADLRRRLVSGGLRVARDHSWPAIAGRTEEAFERLAAPGA
jgi:glycosyltransferase involved in cell wall biosynthesis